MQLLRRLGRLLRRRRVIEEMTAVSQGVLLVRYDEEIQREWGLDGPAPQAWSNDEESDGD